MSSVFMYTDSVALVSVAIIQLMQAATRAAGIKQTTINNVIVSGTEPVLVRLPLAVPTTDPFEFTPSQVTDLFQKIQSLMVTLQTLQNVNQLGASGTFTGSSTAVDTATISAYGMNTIFSELNATRLTVYAGLAFTDENLNNTFSLIVNGIVEYFGYTLISPTEATLLLYTTDSISGRKFIFHIEINTTTSNVLIDVTELNPVDTYVCQVAHMALNYTEGYVDRLSNVEDHALRKGISLQTTQNSNRTIIVKQPNLLVSVIKAAALATPYVELSGQNLKGLKYRPYIGSETNLTVTCTPEEISTTTGIGFPGVRKVVRDVNIYYLGDIVKLDSFTHSPVLVDSAVIKFTDGTKLTYKTEQSVVAWYYTDADGVEAKLSYAAYMEVHKNVFALDEGDKDVTPESNELTYNSINSDFGKVTLKNDELTASVVETPTSRTDTLVVSSTAPVLFNEYSGLQIGNVVAVALIFAIMGFLAWYKSEGMKEKVYPILGVILSWFSFATPIILLIAFVTVIALSYGDFDNRVLVQVMSGMTMAFGFALFVLYGIAYLFWSRYVNSFMSPALAVSFIILFVMLAVQVTLFSAQGSEVDWGLYGSHLFTGVLVVSVIALILRNQLAPMFAVSSTNEMPTSYAVSKGNTFRRFLIGLSLIVVLATFALGAYVLINTGTQCSGNQRVIENFKEDGLSADENNALQEAKNAYTNDFCVGMTNGYLTAGVVPVIVIMSILIFYCVPALVNLLRMSFNKGDGKIDRIKVIFSDEGNSFFIFLVYFGLIFLGLTAAGALYWQYRSTSGFIPNTNGCSMLQNRIDMYTNSSEIETLTTRSSKVQNFMETFVNSNSCYSSQYYLMFTVGLVVLTFIAFVALRRQDIIIRSVSRYKAFIGFMFLIILLLGYAAVMSNSTSILKLV